MTAEISILRRETGEKKQEAAASLETATVTFKTFRVGRLRQQKLQESEDTNAGRLLNANMTNCQRQER